MYPVLIIRAEIVCLVIIVFLFFTSKSYNFDRDKKSFRRLLVFAFLHVCFDITTVLTVNNVQTLPQLVNWGCHVVFYLTAIFFSNEICNYVISMCYPQRAKMLYGAGHIIAALYIGSLYFLPIQYEEVSGAGTWSSTGPAAYAGYGVAFFFFFVALIVLFCNMDKMSISIKRALIPMMFILIIAELSQIIWRELLFTGCAITIVTVGFFFSLENPVEVFKQKAMTDALTGVRSRGSYESDIRKLDERFKMKPNEDYIFVFCDLNGLRNVNNQFGHNEGDNYITLIASCISQCMKNASAVYRIGGDEFLIYYYKIPDHVVEKEIKELQSSCLKASEKMKYTASVSAGYAKSSIGFRSLKDVIKTADYEMYQNKAKTKNQNSFVDVNVGTKLNYSGLTDKIFDAMCNSNERSYPYLTNLETNVTRISPAWKEYFGLKDEFYADFNSVWLERVHPDYVDGYNEDIAAVLNGHKKYHNYEYYAKKANGEYVKVSCHGSVYRDKGDNCSYFSGFMINHAMEEKVDSVTGLRNFDEMTTLVCAYMDQKKPFSVIKLKLNDFSRVNMLYGYGGGNEIIRKIAGLIHDEMDSDGEIFCQGSTNFSILIENTDQNTIEGYYKRIFDTLSRGIETETGAVPVVISGGAIINKGERMEIQEMRRGLVYALEESGYARRNELVFYDVIKNQSSQTDFALLAEIHNDALTDIRFFRVRYQPIAEIATGKIVGAEALVRWIHPVYGEVPPGKFISFIENDPCYYRLGLWIIEQAVIDSKKIQTRVPEFRINVNITALQLQNENFADHVLEVLRKYDYAPSALILELTERCKEMDSTFLARKIRELRRKGFLVAFDDLGTGYSTINLLMDIPVDEIKLDRDFVIDLQTKENYRLFVRTLVLGSFSGGNNYTICFEGIENQEMLDFVGQFGNYLAQGYYFSKPLLIEDFYEFVGREHDKKHR